MQRLEREGLNRAQAEGIMTAIAEVIDESIRNMTSNMVTKADQEKVRKAQFRQKPVTLGVWGIGLSTLPSSLLQSKPGFRI